MGSVPSSCQPNGESRRERMEKATPTIYTYAIVVLCFKKKKKPYPCFS